MNSSSASDSAPATCGSVQEQRQRARLGAADEQRLDGLEELRPSRQLSTWRRARRNSDPTERATAARARFFGRERGARPRPYELRQAAQGYASSSRLERRLRLPRPLQLLLPRAARARRELRPCASCRCRPLRQGTEFGHGQRAPRRASPRRESTDQHAHVALGRGVSGDRSVAHAHGLRKAVPATRDRGDHGGSAAMISDRPPCQADRASNRAVGHHRVRPDALQDLALGDHSIAVADEMEQELWSTFGLEQNRCAALAGPARTVPRRARARRSKRSSSRRSWS